MAGRSPKARALRALDLRRDARRFPRAAQRDAHEHSRVASGQGNERSGAAGHRPRCGDLERLPRAVRRIRASCLFGHFTVADAYYAPVVMRFITYDVPLPAGARHYVEAVRGLPAVADWMSAARQETEFVAADEPYATKA